jgi:hypothetical protein
LLAKKKEKERKNVSLLPFPPIIKYWHIQYSYTRPIKKLPLKHINKLDLLISVNGQYRIKGFIQNMKGNRLFKIQAFSFASFILRKCALSLPHVPRPSSVCKALKRGSYSMDTPTRLYRQVLSLPKQTNSTTPKKSKKKKKKQQHRKIRTREKRNPRDMHPPQLKCLNWKKETTIPEHVDYATSVLVSDHIFGQSLSKRRERVSFTALLFHILLLSRPFFFVILRSGVVS